MDTMCPTRRTLVAVRGAFALMVPASAHAQEAEARAEGARARVGIGVGGMSLGPLSHAGPFHSVVAASTWGAVPLGTHVQLTPSFALYRATAYGAGPGWKTDLSLGLEYVISSQRFRFVPGIMLSLTRAGVVMGRHRGVGAGVSFALQVPVAGPLEAFARSEHRGMVTAAEVVLVNQAVFGPALGF